MAKKSKLILGLSSEKKKKKTSKDFSEEERRIMIEEYLSTDMTKRDVWEKYAGDREEHGAIIRWIRMYGYKDTKVLKRVFTFAANQEDMQKKGTLEEDNQTFEKLQLKKRIEELEKQLKDAEMKSIAFSTMIDIAEKEFEIKIRKKLNSKP